MTTTDPQHDSGPATRKHIHQVQTLMLRVAHQLLERALTHDASKLEEPEKGAFDRAHKRLQRTAYGSAERQAALTILGEALEHHYAHNRHHPEHHPDGVDGMTLIDLTEMLCDWIAAAQERDGRNPHMPTNRARFHLTPQLERILTNTITELTR